MSAIDTISAHSFRGRSRIPGQPWVLACTCGWSVDVSGTGAHDRSIHNAHLADELQAAGIALVALPEPKGTVWHTEDGQDVWVKSDGTVGMDDGDMSDTPATWFYPSEARSLAAALWAAADGQRA